MPTTIRITATDGSLIEYVDEVIGQGGMKDVYFSPDKSYVVAFYRDTQDFNAKDRLETIVGTYREKIFNQEGGDYWKELFCWPTKVVEHNGKLGVVAPTYFKHFFFEHGSRNNDFLGIRGKDKEGKWFASANHRKKHIDPRELGNWRSYLTTCLKIARAVRRMHAAGLAHSDLSYKNVLVDPTRGNACLIDIDGLVVPGKFPPDVVGTPDFIAPEVLTTIALPTTDKNKNLPRIETDRHALSVLIYMYLLYRHPLRGGKIHHSDPALDESMSMGGEALFIEHPMDHSNRPNLSDVSPGHLPWADIIKVPYTICGPYLKTLFDRAFVDGLHEPSKRPTADDWEHALVKTVDLLQPCFNEGCEQGWYVFDNTTSPKCPFCQTLYRGQLPVLNLYSSRSNDRYLPDNHRLMVYTNQYLYPWHVNRMIFPNEKIQEENKKPVGYFVFHQGKWVFVNQTLRDMKDITSGTAVSVAVGSMIELRDGQQIVLSGASSGRLIHVQMVGG